MLVAAARVGVGSQIGRSTTCFTSIQTGRKDTTGREQPGRTRDAKNTQQAAAYSAAKRHEYLTQSPRYRATNKGRAMRWPSTTVIPTGKISDDTNKAPQYFMVVAQTIGSYPDQAAPVLAHGLQTQDDGGMQTAVGNIATAKGQTKVCHVKYAAMSGSPGQAAKTIVDRRSWPVHDGRFRNGIAEVAQPIAGRSRYRQ